MSWLLVVVTVLCVLPFSGSLTHAHYGSWAAFLSPCAESRPADWTFATEKLDLLRVAELKDRTQPVLLSSIFAVFPNSMNLILSDLRLANTHEQE